MCRWVLENSPTIKYHYNHFKIFFKRVNYRKHYRSRMAPFSRKKEYIFLPSNPVNAESLVTFDIPRYKQIKYVCIFYDIETRHHLSLIVTLTWLQRRNELHRNSQVCVFFCRTSWEYNDLVLDTVVQFFFCTVCKSSVPHHCGDHLLPLIWAHSPICRVKFKVPWHATRCGVLSRYKPFWKSAPYDITGGRVHLAVWRMT